jgi:ZIP family zinc transporter
VGGGSGSTSVTNVGVTSGLALLVATSLVVGAVAAAWLRLSPSLAALISSFGGGILLAAVGFELLPEADRGAGPAFTAGGLLLGAAVYVAADTWLTRDEQMEHTRRSGHAAAAGQPMRMPGGGAAGTGASTDVGRGEAIAAGIVVDGIPESLALGLMAADGQPGLALLIAVVVGNVTEAYGAAQPILAGGRSKRFAIGLLGGIGVLLGLTTLLGASAVITSATLIGLAQAIAAGAVIAVLSISIIPYTFKEVSSRAALATILGFTVGYLLS